MNLPQLQYLKGPMANIATSDQLQVKSADDIASDMLRSLKNGLITYGIANPNVGPNTDFGIIAQSLANEVAIAENNAVIAADSRMPDTAIGSDLDRILQNNGLARRPASSATGFVIASANATSLIPTGAQLLTPSGVKFFVVQGGSYANGASIKVQAIDTGSKTNVSAGTALTWTSQPAFFAPTALVDSNGLTDGVDAEDDTTARNRLISKLANPPGVETGHRL